MRLPKKRKGLGKGLDILSSISGISKKEIKQIALGVMENKKLLNSCHRHDFNPHPSPHMSRRFICKHCEGVVGIIEKNWYEKGLMHAYNKEEV